MKIMKGQEMEQQSHLEIQAQIAKVLASENIDVEFRNVETAAFDPIERRLIIPQYKDGLSKSMYDLFIGHEVGHALYTPQVSPSDIRPDLPNFGQFVNVVEDVRIERKIRNRFGGLTKSFINGYNDLLNRNFFGDFEKTPLSTRPLADRLNIFFKIGELNSGLEFFDIENDIKNKIESAETWEQVVSAAEVLYNYSKNEQLEKENNDTTDQERGDNDEESEYFEGDEEENSNDEEKYDEDDEQSSEQSSSDEGEGEGDEQSSEQSSSEEGEDDEQEGNEEINGYSNGYSDFEPNIETQTEFDKNRINNIDDISNEKENIYIDEFNLGEIIINYKDLYCHLDNSMSKAGNPLQPKSVDNMAFLKNNWNKFRSENNKVIMSSAREFEMRKSADDFKRSKVSKTGVIDMGALHKYRFTEDIFLKQTVVKDGKNHSLTMFVDWSGSMADIMVDTINQLQVLVLFCKKVNIPFEVYAFTNNFASTYMYDEMRERYFEFSSLASSNYKRKVPLYKKNHGSFVITDEFALLNLFSSDMSKNEFEHANIWLEYVKKDMSRFINRYAEVDPLENFARWFALGGTPLNETYAIIPQLMETLNKKRNSQINNIVFLTDGCGSSTHLYYDKRSENHNNISRGDIIIDKKNKRSMTFKGRKSGHGNIIQLLATRVKEQVNCNLINFHIVDPRSLNLIYNEFFIPINWSQIRENSRELRRDGFIIEGGTYYDKMYIVNKKNIKITDDNILGGLIAGEATKTQIKNALIKDTKGNKKNRIIMNNFASLVAA